MGLIEQVRCHRWSHWRALVSEVMRVLLVLSSVVVPGVVVVTLTCLFLHHGSRHLHGDRHRGHCERTQRRYQNRCDAALLLYQMWMELIDVTAWNNSETSDQLRGDLR